MEKNAIKPNAFCYLSKMRFFIPMVCLLFISLAGFSQSKELAQNYFDQGEYEKAESIYKKLYEKNKGNYNYLSDLVTTLQEQEKYEEAGKFLEAHAQATPNYPVLKVNIGYNYQLMGNEAEAQKYYEEAIEMAEKVSNYAYSIGNTFQRYNLLEEAVEVYEIALEKSSSPNLIVQLAQIYGELGNYTKMFDTYISLVEERPEYYHAINRSFSEFVSDDKENDANQTLRKLLLKKLQEEPHPLYNRILSWLFVQQKDFKPAFIQEKAIYQRAADNDLRDLVDLALIAAENQDREVATEILEYTIEKAVNKEEKLEAYGHLFAIEISHAQEKDYQQIEKKFQAIFDEFGKSLTTLDLQIAYANFLTFQQNQQEEAVSLLNNLLAENPNRFQEAKIKMVLADILVLEEKFNQALIYYSQIQNLVKNNTIAQEAGFKVAKTSYYKGDFKWAQTQLKVLKTSTTQLIANDAMQLHLLISDNSQEDSTQTALKLFARADLLHFQNKNQEALGVLDTILEQHKGESIEDEALFRKAEIYKAEEEYTKAEENYLTLIQFYGEDILADDAYYALAEMYNFILNEPVKAKENYEQIIFNFADSIYFVEARKKYRQLRGDAIN